MNEIQTSTYEKIARIKVSNHAIPHKIRPEVYIIRVENKPASLRATFASKLLPNKEIRPWSMAIEREIRKALLKPWEKLCKLSENEASGRQCKSVTMARRNI
ncbi:MAG: hypothetical protein K2M67_02325 [Muribaculaceae bacterium]|nr:hypothetical protein [Muribaculaceae bacterium]